MAWFRMMGVNSVEYHRQTVLARDDDYPGAALDYYGSRGETPLAWGGKIAGRLGLEGAVADVAYDAIYGPGGAKDPILGSPLATTKRPGTELVVAAHKSVALLGVIGRADDMHAILDAESTATLGYLEAWFERQGGRRGKHHARTPTGGLLWARTRHATSRAGDPAPHDHVLIANLTELLDDGGGWRALDTAGLRDLTHAATMAGRAAGARAAVELGYGIERDDGPSGKLGHWRIAGIPSEACEALSKRSADIELAMEATGFTSPRARGVAARDTRSPKTDENPDQLLPRWLAELEEIGWSVEALIRAVVHAAASMTKRVAPSDGDLANWARALLARDGELGKRKAFTRHDVVRAVAPNTYGLPVGELDSAVRAVIEHYDAIPLVGTPGARGRAWAGADGLAVEQAIADVAERLAGRRAGKVDGQTAVAAIDAIGTGGQVLTRDQRDAVVAICTSGRGLDLIVGVAGAGKTTALEIVRRAFENDGHRVLGAATSGQAARALADGAGVHSRTVASLLARMRTGSLTLDPRTVLLLDEAGMIDDTSLLALLKAAEDAGSKVIVIGDQHQLSAVGAGGGLEALVHRHRDAVHLLRENVRQGDAGERHALDHLRDGDLTKAIAWYRRRDRLVVRPTRADVISSAVDAWEGDIAAGRTSLLLAWRRADVTALNAEARRRRRDAGELGDHEHPAAGGRAYSVGDRVLARQPLGEGAMSTSERGTVTSSSDTRITILTDRGAILELDRSLTGTDHLDHAYAITVHRAQGATVDRAHLVADGGGRELAYVGMSRGRESNHVHLVADDVDQAIDDLRREWAIERRDRWVHDTDAPALPGEPSQPRLSRRADQALRAALLRAEHAAVLDTLGPDRTSQIAALRIELARIERRLDDLETGAGAPSDTPAGELARRRHEAHLAVRHAEQVLADPRLSWRTRRTWSRALTDAVDANAVAEAEYDRLIDPLSRDLRNEASRLREQLTPLEHDEAARRQRVRAVELVRRLQGIEREMPVLVRDAPDHGMGL